MDCLLCTNALPSSASYKSDVCPKCREKIESKPYLDPKDVIDNKLKDRENGK